MLTLLSASYLWKQEFNSEGGILREHDHHDEVDGKTKIDSKTDSSSNLKDMVDSEVCSRLLKFRNSRDAWFLYLGRLEVPA